MPRYLRSLDNFHPHFSKTKAFFKKYLPNGFMSLWSDYEIMNAEAIRRVINRADQSANGHTSEKVEWVSANVYLAKNLLAEYVAEEYQDERISTMYVFFNCQVQFTKTSHMSDRKWNPTRIPTRTKMPGRISRQLHNTHTSFDVCRKIEVDQPKEKAVSSPWLWKDFFNNSK